MILSFFSKAQIYTAKQGSTLISFFSSAPLENIEAQNKGAVIIYKNTTNDIQIRVSIQNFKFKNALMEEHFNENYAESNIYPKANFKGKINDFDLKTLDNNKNMFFSGTLEFHGKSKILKKTPLNVSKTLDGSLILVGVFKVNIDDFAIEIPKIVSNKISKTVDVSFNFILKKK